MSVLNLCVCKYSRYGEEEKNIYCYTKIDVLCCKTVGWSIGWCREYKGNKCCCSVYGDSLYLLEILLGKSLKNSYCKCHGEGIVTW